MHRTVFALALVGCMVWLTGIGAVEPGGQEKPPPTKDVKQEEKKKSDVQEDGKAAVEKKIIGVKVAVPAMRVAPAQKVDGGKAKAAIPRKAAIAVKAVPAMNINVIGQQFLPHFQKIHKAELHFMRMVCECNRQQYEKVAGETGPALKEMAEKFGQKNQNGFIIVNAGLAGTESDDQNDPQLQITQAVSKAVRKNLTTEQADRYEQEIADRMESSKQAVALAYVAKMDKLLHLTADQRDRLTKLLNKKWKYSASRARLLTLGDGYFPAMPDSEISEILSAPQKRVWTAVQRGNVSFGVSLNEDNEAEIQEAWDEPAKKPAASETKTPDKKTTPDKAKL